MSFVVTEESASVADFDERVQPESRMARRARKTKKVKKQRPLWQEIPILLLIAAVLSFLLQTFIARVYMIPSESMEPTLIGCKGCTGDRIVVEKLSYDFGDPQPGDVVVFKGPSSSWNVDYTSIRSGNPVVHGLQNALSIFGLVPPDENDLVKRVVAIGGQTVQCCDVAGRIEVNGKSVVEPYIHFGNPGDFDLPPGVQACSVADPFRDRRCFGPIKVPNGNLWVMGDNRADSADSRFHTNDEFHGTVPVADVRGKAVFKIWPLSRVGTVRSGNPQ